MNELNAKIKVTHDLLHRKPNFGILSILRSNIVRNVTKFIMKRGSIREELSTRTAIKYSSAEIERELKVKVVVMTKVKKAYGSNTNSFRVGVLTEHNEYLMYFLKFGRNNYIDDELKGDACIQGKLNSPRAILSSKKKFFGYEWILYDYIEGPLMSEVFSDIRNQKQFNSFIALERRKELKLVGLYSKQTGLLDYNRYIKSRANKLFFYRFTGQRYREFYKTEKSNISNLFNRKIILNGQTLPLTVEQIIYNLLKKYTNHDDTLRVESILGHGDAHHGNIIINKKIWFIDNEYADVTTPLMEIAKPYYNDFLGGIFFGGIRMYNSLFRIDSFRDDGTDINSKITVSDEFQRFIEIASIKLKLRRHIVNKNTKDFISFNDYLFLCHILTKNPNDYSLRSQRLFLILAVVIQLSDPYDPESIYSFFK